MKRYFQIFANSFLFFCFLLFNNLFANEKLIYIGDQNLPTGQKFKNTEIGGLSGLTYDQEKKRLLLISDDRGNINDPRIYEFDVTLEEKIFTVTPKEVIILKTQEGKSFKKGSVDFEGIALFKGNLLLSSEGSLNQEPPIFPELLLFSRQGEYKNSIEIPNKFFPQKMSPHKIGARDNLAFEALSVTPDERSVWMGTEEALYQDGPTSTVKKGSTLRLIQYLDLKPTKEIGYTLESIPNNSIAGLSAGETGLSEILAINENQFYSLERSYLPLAQKVIIRIFKNTISKNTTDISKIETLKNKKIITPEKELIANLEDFNLQMSVGFQKLDNIEGMCFGPKLKNGHNTLILVSDNNFNIFQRTQFLALEIVP